MFRRTIRTGIGAALAALALAGCGTATFDNQFAVTVADPSGRLGTDQVQVAVFDPMMGDTRDWARQHMGVATPTEPYRTSVFATDTKMIGDSSPPSRVVAGMFLPQYDPSGFYSITLQPVAGQTVDYEAPYVTYDYSWETTGKKRPTGPPLPMTITTSQDGDNWQFDIQVQIPPG